MRVCLNEGWGFCASGSAQSFKLMVWDLIIFSQGSSSSPFYWAPPSSLFFRHGIAFLRNSKISMDQYYSNLGTDFISVAEVHLRFQVHTWILPIMYQIEKDLEEIFLRGCL